jgi:phage FluMu protein Com
MVVVVNCKRCGKELRAKDRYAGMATRCPGCDTINQLPSLPSSPPPRMATPPRKPAWRKKPWEESESAKPSTSPDTCKICGKPIRGKAERFTDVHGTVYHLGCYQQQAGDAPEDACRICQGGFASEKERVKDVVGFFYHRECYQEELERQRLGASGAKPKEKTDAASKKPTEPKPKPEPEPEEDDWNLTPDPEEDWELDGDVDDGWMRPDQDELEVKDEEKSTASAEPSIKLPAKPVERPTSNRLPRKGESRPRQPAAPAKGSNGASEDPPPEVAKSKPASPRPASKGASPSKPRQAKPATSESTAGVPRKAAPAPKAKASSDPKSPKPATSSGTTAKKKSTTARAKPLRRAKPIEERPPAALPAKPVEERPLPASPALPAGLELLPEQDSLPEGLELLPESPVDNGADGLEILDDVPVASPTGTAVPNSPAPGTASSAGVGGLVGLDSLDGLEPLEELEPLNVQEPLGGSPFPLAAPSAPTGTGGLDEPVQGILLDPLTGQPATAGPARHNSENSIPVWLWAVMGVGVAFVLIMLVSSVVSVMWTNEKNSQPIASAGSSETSEYSEAAGEEDFDYENFDEEGGAYSDVERKKPTSPDDPPRTLLQMCGRMAANWRAMSGGVKAGTVIGGFFGLAIALALQSLALRVACNMCGEPDVSGNKLVGICVTQMAGCFVAGFLTVTVDLSVAWIIEIPIRFVICAIVIKTMLPAPGWQSVGITILQWVMMFVIAFLVGLAIVIAVGGMIIAFS